MHHLNQTVQTSPCTKHIIHLCFVQLIGLLNGRIPISLNLFSSLCKDTSQGVLLAHTYLKDFETGNIQYTNKELSLDFSVQGLVDTVDKPGEHTVVQRLDGSLDSVVTLVHVLSLGHHLCTDLDLWLQDVLEQVLGIDTKEMGSLLTEEL